MKLFLKNLLFSLIVPGSVGVYLPLLLVRGRSPSTGPLLWLALPLFVLGLAIYVACVMGFARVGRGTPLPLDAPRTLVVRGPYRISRNAMYVGVLATILGWAALYRSPWVLLEAAVVGTAFHLFVVLYEEPHLRRTFGKEYDDYCARVGRWLPRVR